MTVPDRMSPCFCITDFLKVVSQRMVQRADLQACLA